MTVITTLQIFSLLFNTGQTLILGPIPVPTDVITYQDGDTYNHELYTNPSISIDFDATLTSFKKAMMLDPPLPIDFSSITSKPVFENFIEYLKSELKLYAKKEEVTTSLPSQNKYPKLNEIITKLIKNPLASPSSNPEQIKIWEKLANDSISKSKVDLYKKYLAVVVEDSIYFEGENRTISMEKIHDAILENIEMINHEISDESGNLVGDLFASMNLVSKYLFEFYSENNPENDDISYYDLVIFKQEFEIIDNTIAGIHALFHTLASENSPPTLSQFYYIFRAQFYLDFIYEIKSLLRCHASASLYLFRNKNEISYQVYRDGLQEWCIKKSIGDIISKLFYISLKPRAIPDFVNNVSNHESATAIRRLFSEQAKKVTVGKATGGQESTGQETGGVTTSGNTQD